MNLKQQIVQTAYDAGEGHIPSALSIVDIISVLYDKILGPDDRFILSKGHGSLALYIVLFTKGMISKEQLTTFGKYDSILGGHPDRNKVPGVVASTGSLGHGLPIAVGIALAKKIKGEPGRIYCLVGDGECNEGSIWEAAMLATHHKLYNLTVIVDYNHSTDRALNLDDIANKFRAFGFGGPHNPIADIVNTAKGSGCVRMADPAWHHRVPNAIELTEILKELE